MFLTTLIIILSLRFIILNNNLTIIQDFIGVIIVTGDWSVSNFSNDPTIATISNVIIKDTFGIAIKAVKITF